MSPTAAKMRLSRLLVWGQRYIQKQNALLRVEPPSTVLERAHAHAELELLHLDLEAVAYLIGKLEAEEREEVDEAASVAVRLVPA
jgi:hypothetical protein